MPIVSELISSLFRNIYSNLIIARVYYITRELFIRLSNGNIQAAIPYNMERKKISTKIFQKFARKNN